MENVHRAMTFGATALYTQQSKIPYIKGEK